MYRLYLQIIVPLLSLALTACAEFQDKPLDAVETAVRLEKRDLTALELKNFMEEVIGQPISWPLTTWNIDSLSLAAIYYHPDVAISLAQAEVLQAANITAAQRPNPTLNTTPSYLTHIASTALPWYAVSNLNIPIETAGKRGFRQAKAEHLSEAAQLRVSDTAWLVRGRLRQAVLEVFLAQENERLLGEQLILQQAITSHWQLQYAAGEITPAEWLRLQLVFNQLQMNAGAAAKRTAESKVLLATAIGLPVEAVSGINIDFSTLSKPAEIATIPSVNFKQIALQQRPDILAALADYAAAQSALQLEIANQYPNIQANPGYAWELGENLWSLGASIQLPVFHQNQGLIAEAEARRREMSIRFEALQQKVIGDVDRAKAGVQAVLNKWQTAGKQKDLQQATLNTMLNWLQAGEIDTLTWLTTQLEASLAERARLDVLIETQQALNNLEDSLRYPLASSLNARLITNSAVRKSTP